VAIEVKQIEGDHHDLFGLPLEFVLQNREIRGAVLCRGARGSSFTVYEWE
jgi:hypothetical protein